MNRREDMKKFLMMATVVLPIGACNSAYQQDRAVAGGLIGAGTGAVIGGLATGRAGGALAGAAIGGAGGALIGAASVPRYCRGYDDYGRPIRVSC
jgi:osmotically inducible lipoprotein OsmB